MDFHPQQTCSTPPPAKQAAMHPPKENVPFSNADTQPQPQGDAQGDAQGDGEEVPKMEAHAQMDMDAPAPGDVRRSVQLPTSLPPSQRSHANPSPAHVKIVTRKSTPFNTALADSIRECGIDAAIAAGDLPDNTEGPPRQLVVEYPDPTQHRPPSPDTPS